MPAISLLLYESPALLNNITSYFWNLGESSYAKFERQLQQHRAANPDNWVLIDLDHQMHLAAPYTQHHTINLIKLSDKDYDLLKDLCEIYEDFPEESNVAYIAHISAEAESFLNNQFKKLSEQMYNGQPPLSVPAKPQYRDTSERNLKKLVEEKQNGLDGTYEIASKVKVAAPKYKVRIPIIKHNSSSLGHIAITAVKEDASGAEMNSHISFNPLSTRDILFHALTGGNVPVAATPGSEMHTEDFNRADVILEKEISEEEYDKVVTYQKNLVDDINADKVHYSVFTEHVGVKATQQWIKDAFCAPEDNAGILIPNNDVAASPEERNINCTKSVIDALQTIGIAMEAIIVPANLEEPLKNQGFKEVLKAGKVAKPKSVVSNRDNRDKHSKDYKEEAFFDKEKYYDRKDQYENTPSNLASSNKVNIVADDSKAADEEPFQIDPVTFLW